MRSTKKRLYAVITVLLALLMLTLASCKPSSSGGDDSSAPPKLDKVFDISGFKLIRADESSQTVTDATLALRDAIKETCGYEIAIETDWVKKGDPIPTDTLEILVGDTNRREVGFDTRANDYRIQREGNRIYLLGATDEAVAKGVELFIKDYLAKGGTLLPDNTNFADGGEYIVEKLSFGAAKISTIKCYDEAKASGNGAFDSIALSILTATGMKTEYVKTEAEANVLFTTKSTDKLGGKDYGTVVEDGKLYIIGKDALSLKFATMDVTETFASAYNELALEAGVKADNTLTKEEFLKQDQLVIYPEFPDKINRDYTYKVSVTQGDKTAVIPVYNHCEDSRTSRNPDREQGADEFRRFSTFAFSGSTVRVDIEVGRDFKSYSVMPSAKNFRSEFKDGVISVYLDKPDYFLVRLDGQDTSILSVFADAPEYVGDIEIDENTLVVDGWYEAPDGTGVLKLDKEGQKVYIKPGAVLNARLRISADNCKVTGYGAMLDPFGDIYEYDPADTNEGKNSTTHFIWITSCSNAYIEGVHLLNAKGYNLYNQGTWNAYWNENVQVINLKALSSQMCTDGIAFGYFTKGSLAEHCFLYCGDNCLVFEEYATYRDMTIGTTCNAIFPQTDIPGNTLEDIHVFRADEGIINHEMNGGGVAPGIALIENISITNLDTVDVTYSPYFLYAESGVTVSGDAAPDSFKIKNVSIGEFSDIDMRMLALLENKGGKYPVLFTNIAVNGEKLDPKEFVVGGKYWYRVNNNGFKYETTDDFVPVVHTENTVNYTAPNKVFIGSWQIFFANPVYKDGDGLLLPYEEIKYELRCGDKDVTTVDKNGIKYVSSADLVSSGMADHLESTDSGIVLTPVYDGENLMLPDEGAEVSRFVETVSYQQHLSASIVDGKAVYKVTPTGTAETIGMGCNLNEEIKKYGTGEYRLSVKIKSSVGADKIKLSIDYKNNGASPRTFEVTNEWAEYGFDFRVTSAKERSQISLLVGGSGEAPKAFEITEFSLVKIG